jgi:hypothetical protein
MYTRVTSSGEVIRRTMPSWGSSSTNSPTGTLRALANTNIIDRRRSAEPHAIHELEAAGHRRAHWDGRLMRHEVRASAGADSAYQATKARRASMVMRSP